MTKKTTLLVLLLLFIPSLLCGDLKDRGYRFSQDYHLLLTSNTTESISFSSYRLTSPNRIIVEIHGEVLIKTLQKPSNPVTKIEVKDGGETLRLIFYLKEHSFYSILNRDNSVLLSFASIPLEDENDFSQAIASLETRTAEQRRLIAQKSGPQPKKSVDRHQEEKMIAQLALSLQKQEKEEQERLRLAEIAKVEAEKERQRQIALLAKKQEKERQRVAEIAQLEAEKERLRLAEIERIKAEKEKVQLAEIAQIAAEKEQLRLVEIERIKVEKEKNLQIALLKQKQEEERKQKELALKKAEEKRLRLVAIETERIETERLRKEELLRQKQEEEKRRQALALKKAEEERLRAVEEARIKAEKEHEKQLALLKQKEDERQRTLLKQKEDEEQLALLKQKEDEKREQTKEPLRKKMIKTASGDILALKVTSSQSDRSLDGETPTLAVTTMRKEGVLSNLYFRKFPRFSRITMELTGDVDYQLKEIKGGYVINIYNFKVVPKRLLNIIDTRYFNSVVKYIYPKRVGGVFKIYIKTGKGTAVRQSKEALMVNFDFYTPTIK